MATFMRVAMYFCIVCNYRITVSLNAISDQDPTIKWLNFLHFAQEEDLLTLHCQILQPYYAALKQ